MITILLAALLLHGPAAVPSDTASDIYRAVLRDLGTQYQPTSLVLTSVVRDCIIPTCRHMDPQGYAPGFLQEVQKEGLVQDHCTYVSGECIKSGTGKGWGLKDVVVTLDSPMPCGNGCYEVRSVVIVVRNRSVQDITTLHRVEEVSGHWNATRTKVLGKGIIN